MLLNFLYVPNKELMKYNDRIDRHEYIRKLVPVIVTAGAIGVIALSVWFLIF